MDCVSPGGVSFMVIVGGGVVSVFEIGIRVKIFIFILCYPLKNICIKIRFSLVC